MEGNDDAAPADELQTEFTLELIKPVSVGKIEYTELRLSEPTAGQLIKAGKAGTRMEQLCTLIQLNAKVPWTAIEQIAQRDIEAAADFFGRFGSESPTP